MKRQLRVCSETSRMNWYVWTQCETWGRKETRHHASWTTLSSTQQLSVLILRKSSSWPFGGSVPELGEFQVSSNSTNHSDLQDSLYEEAVTVTTRTQTKLPFNTVKVTFTLEWRSSALLFGNTVIFGTLKTSSTAWCWRPERWQEPDVFGVNV